MCTSFTVNRKKTLVGWNLDILGMTYRVRESDEGVFIEILDDVNGWLPLFGVNDRGDFVGMPTCWPFDDSSDPKGSEENVMMLDIDLLLKKKTFKEIKSIAEKGNVCSIPGSTFMSSITSPNGDVLHIIPGQGYRYYEKPEAAVLTNFSPFKGDSEKHPWMGMDRYLLAEKMIKEAGEDIDAKDCFEILKAVSQTVCPTVVSMVFDVNEKTIFWCENRDYSDIHSKKFSQ